MDRDEIMDQIEKLEQESKEMRLQLDRSCHCNRVDCDDCSLRRSDEHDLWNKNRELRSLKRQLPEFRKDKPAWLTES